MKPIFTVLFLFLVLHVFSGEGISGRFNDNRSSNPDSVSVASIPFNCFWVNQPVEYKSNFGSNVEFEAPKKTDLLNFADGSFTANTAPMLLFYPDSNFVLTARVDIQCPGNYSGGALMVYADEKNWAKLLFEHSPNGEYAIWTGVTNEITDDNKNKVVNNKFVYLRIAKKGVLYCFYYSIDGHKWELIRSFGQSRIKPVSIGFLVQSPDENSCVLPFSEISYRGVGFNDFWTGN